ncbi:MAG TPA: V-type ATPase subunit [Candidatus Onthovicinus excrementipullorum]|nr:V-type ATPase subunit [Candidatus Onthovicinus excrementipullorum]
MLNRFSSNTILAKAHAMYAGQLTAANYNDLLNCKSVGEIATYLKNRTVYADVLQDAVTETLHRKQLESILRKRLFNQYASMCRYELSIGTELYRCFIIQAEVEEILSFLRFLCNHHPEDYIFSLPPFLNEHTKLNLFALAEIKDFEEILRVLNGTEYFKIVEPFVRQSRETGEIDYFSLEAEMKKYEFDTLCDIVDQAFSGSYKKDVRSYLEREVDIENIINIYRLKHTIQASKEEIDELLVFGRSALTKQELEYLAAASTDTEFLARLKNTRIGQRLREKNYDYLEEGVQKVRFDLEKYSFRFSTNPYIVMFSYIFLAENEVRNITHIIEGIRYSIPPETIKTMLIGVDG